MTDVAQDVRIKALAQKIVMLGQGHTPSDFYAAIAVAVGVHVRRCVTPAQQREAVELISQSVREIVEGKR
jgi:hypothetical protein